MKKRIMSIFMVFAVVLATMTIPKASNVKSVEAATFEDLSQNDIIAAMGAGWNLGNQLEASNNGTPSETAWGNPTITKSMIQAVANAGFKTIRIPISWLSYIGSGPDYTINTTWMNRIQEVVDYAIDCGLYVIMNVHGDGYESVSGGWLLPGSSDQTTIKAKYTKVYKQIATRFASYDEHLIFESMNEVGADANYDANKIAAYYKNINAYNQIFVDTVRSTGGNNAKRWLLIPGWNTNIDYTAGNYGFVIPSDSKCTASGKRIMISVHYYSPWEFCGNQDYNITQWGNNANTSKTVAWCGEDYLASQIQSMYNTFVSKGYPVVIGEYGSVDKSAGDSTNTTYRAYFAKRVCEEAKGHGCVPVIWDNGYNGAYGFGLFNRSNATVTQQKIIDAIKGVFGTSSPTVAPTVKPTVTPTVAPTVTPTVKPTVAPTVAPTLTPSGALQLTSTTDAWSGGFVINMNIKNTSSSTINDWTLTLNKAEFNVSSIWNATITESGNFIIIKPVSWNKSIASGSSISFGIQCVGTPVSNYSYTLN